MSVIVRAKSRRTYRRVSVVQEVLHLEFRFCEYFLEDFAHRGDMAEVMPLQCFQFPERRFECVGVHRVLFVLIIRVLGIGIIALALQHAHA